jgi:excisionase family DNA binding protein
MNENFPFPPELITKGAVAYLMSVSERKVAELVAQNKLTVINDGGRALKFRRDDVLAYINSLPERHP